MRLGTAVAADTLPWLTVAINVAGSFLLGCLVTAGDHLSPELRTGLAVGLLGGFTTFSTFSVQIFVDLETGNGGKAAAYFLAVSGARRGRRRGRLLRGSGARALARRPTCRSPRS